MINLKSTYNNCVIVSTLDKMSDHSRRGRQQRSWLRLARGEYRIRGSQLDELYAIASTIRRELIYMAELLNIRYPGPELNEDSFGQTFYNAIQHLLTTSQITRDVRNAIMNLVLNRQ